MELPPSLSRIHQLTENQHQMTSEPVAFEPRESQEFISDNIAQGMAVLETGRGACTHG